MRQISIALVLLCCAISLSAQQMQVSDKLPTDPNVRIGTLPNGMKYYIRKNVKPEKRMEFRLAVKTGSIMEDDDQQGFAHFTEHMEFNGLAHFPKMDLVNFLEATGVRFGAHLNAYTSFDETVYMLQLPTDSAHIVQKGMQVMVDWAGGATLDEDEIKKERGVVLEEWRLGRGAQERVQKIHLPKEYANSHYADRLPIGKAEVIEHGSADALRRFYHTWYRPNLMAIMAVGDFDVDQMERDIKAKFGTLTNPANEKERTKYTVPMHKDLVVSVASDKELQFNVTQIVFQRPTEKNETVGDYRDQITRQLFIGMLNARLGEIQRKADAPFLQAGANDGADLGKMSEFGLFAILKHEKINSGIAAALGEAVRVQRNGFTATEFEREKTELLRSYEESYNERDKTESRNFISEYVRNFLSNEPMPGITYEYELAKKYIPTITLAEVNGLTKRLIDNAGPVVMVSIKEKDGTTVPTETELRHIYDSVISSNVAAYEDKVLNQPLISTMPTPGKVSSERKIGDLGVTEWTLSNGAKVVVKPTDFKNDEVLFFAQSPGGTSLASNATLRSAMLAAGVVDQSGAGAFDATALEKTLAGKVVSISPSTGSLTEGFSGSASPKDLETLFQLTYLYATEPRYDPEAFQAMIHQIESSIDNKSGSPDAIFRDSVTATMVQYNERGMPLTKESLKTVSLDNIKSFYSDRFADFSDFTFFVVGNIDLAKLKPMVETYLASLPSKNRHESWRDDGIRPPKGTVSKSVYKGIEPKSSVMIAITGPFKYTPENRFKLQALASVLNIKLRETLREEKGGVYGVGVSGQPIHYPEERYQITVGFGCAPDRVDELVAEVMKKLDTIQMKAPEEIYLTKVKQTELKDLEVNLKLNRYWLSGLSAAYLNNEDPHIILNRKDYITSLTSQDVLAAGKQYCNKTNLIEVTLFPEKKQ